MIAAPTNGTDTSAAAAQSLHGHLGRLERLVLDAIRSEGGATCDTVELVTGLSHQTASARINGLAKRGIVEDSGERRKTRSGRFAGVYVAVAWQQELGI